LTFESLADPLNFFRSHVKFILANEGAFKPACRAGKRIRLANNPKTAYAFLERIQLLWLMPPHIYTGDTRFNRVLPLTRMEKRNGNASLRMAGS